MKHEYKLIFEQPDTSGRMSRYKYLQRVYPELYNDILLYVKENNLESLSDKEQIYMFRNDMINVPKCANPNCNNNVNYRNSTLGYYDYCNNKCISSDPNIKERKEQTFLNHYGVKNGLQSEEVKEKLKKTNLERYGVEYVLGSKEIQAKSKKTVMEKYGVDHISHVPDIVERRVETFKREGVIKHRESYKKTCMEKWGVESPWKNKELHMKGIEKSMITRNSQTLELINERLNSDNCELISFDTVSKLVKAKCSKEHEFEIILYNLYERDKVKTIICTTCNELRIGKSGAEDAVSEFIQTLYKGEIIRNTKKVIPPYEVDIYLPELNLAIEYNGLFWHCEKNKSDDYHQMKWEMLKEMGIELITIWEDDWLYKRDIVKQTLINKFSNIIELEDYKIVNITSKEYISFLEQNSLDDILKASLNFGIEYKGEIVSVCALVKSKLGYTMKFCEKIKSNSLDIFIKYLKSNYPDLYIWSDNSTAGFRYTKYELIKIENRQYGYILQDMRVNAAQYTKAKLVKMGYDKNLTQDQIMRSLRFNKIWDAGRCLYKLS